MAAADFDEFYSAHYSKVVAMAYGLTGDLAEAQDLAQEAFCRAWQRWSRIASYDEPLAWVRRVVTNLATSRWRKALVMRRHQRHERTDVPALGPDRVALVAALRRLPHNHRFAIVLHYLGDLPVAEVAQEMGVPQGTVKAWLHRGRAALASHLTEPTHPAGVNSHD